MSRFRLALLAGALSVTAFSQAFALDAPGVWENDRLEGHQENLWKKMGVENIQAAINSMPDNPGSRAITQLAKAVLLAPVTLPGDKAPDGEAKSDTDILAEKITAQRLKKLLAMGGLNEAKTLVNEVDTDATLEPELMEQVALTLVANNTKQAACIDLLAYKSDAAEKFEQLSEGPKSIAADCLHGKNTAAAKKDVSLQELAELSPWDAALKISSDVTSITASANAIADYNKLTPFQQAMVIRSAGMSPRLQWQLLPQALRHDYISVKQAQSIYSEVVLPKDKLTKDEARTAAKGKQPYERLAIYYKTIAGDKNNAAQLTQDLATPIVSSGSTYDIYALLPFYAYFESNLDVHALRQRSSFIVGLTESLNGDSITSPTTPIVPKDAVWILSVLNGDQPFTTDGFTAWSDTNAAMLSGIAPELEYKVAQSLQDMVADDKNKSTYLSDYVNKKSLTKSDNYVMHDVLALSKAESLGEDSAIGSLVTFLAQAGNNTSPDQLDPAGTVKMVSMLNDMGLTHTARKLVAEQLVFLMQPDLPMGNKQIIGE